MAVIKASRITLGCAPLLVEVLPAAMNNVPALVAYPVMSVVKCGLTDLSHTCIQLIESWICRLPTGR